MEFIRFHWSWVPTSCVGNPMDLPWNRPVYIIFDSIIKRILDCAWSFQYKSIFRTIVSFAIDINSLEFVESWSGIHGPKPIGPWPKKSISRTNSDRLFRGALVLITLPDTTIGYRIHLNLGSSIGSFEYQHFHSEGWIDHHYNTFEDSNWNINIILYNI